MTPRQGSSSYGLVIQIGRAVLIHGITSVGPVVWAEGAVDAPAGVVRNLCTSTTWILGEWLSPLAVLRGRNLFEYMATALPSVPAA